MSHIVLFHYYAKLQDNEMSAAGDALLSPESVRQLSQLSQTPMQIKISGLDVVLIRASLISTEHCCVHIYIC